MPAEQPTGPLAADDSGDRFGDLNERLLTKETLVAYMAERRGPD